MLVKRASREGLIKGTVVGSDIVEVIHLQYANDTLMTFEGNEDNASAVKWLLKNFEVLSGLFTNYDKSFVYGINMENAVLERVTGVLGCKVGMLPFPYLRLKVGG